ncbi:hypothetical protein CVU37_14730 [candidate division BRC1 bacterium HGW-BRC1-1]|jgi:Tfp pilus assembly pilus retraction ATPase PilT|nr:MAG: hypothetical protein CVU37_14730 [candidate division BRC1 bacterium HGW-BRC1-1]
MSIPLSPLAEILGDAAERGASSVLFLAGNPPCIRIGRKLQPPLAEPNLTFHDTEAIVHQLTDGAQLTMLHTNDNYEMPFNIAGVTGMVTIFYSQGAHSLVFYLDPVHEPPVIENLPPDPGDPSPNE